jgi:hypothetical protein
VGYRPRGLRSTRIPEATLRHETLEPVDVGDESLLVRQDEPVLGPGTGYVRRVDDRIAAVRVGDAVVVLAFIRSARSTAKLWKTSSGPRTDAWPTGVNHDRGVTGHRSLIYWSGETPFGPASAVPRVRRRVWFTRLRRAAAVRFRPYRAGLRVAGSQR